jgi:CRISP-associated protein Cas1
MGHALANGRGQIVAAGLDPTIGIIHDNIFNRIPLVRDLMVPIRPVVDGAVLDFALTSIFTRGDFTISKWSGCRLNPQLAKIVAGRLATMRADLVAKEFLGQLQRLREL